MPSNDKLLHHFVCFALFLTLVLLGFRPWLFAVPFTAAAAVVWELRRGWNADSPKDLAWGAVGIVDALLVLWLSPLV